MKTIFIRYSKRDKKEKQHTFYFTAPEAIKTDIKYIRVALEWLKLRVGSFNFGISDGCPKESKNVQDRYKSCLLFCLILIMSGYFYSYFGW